MVIKSQENEHERNSKIGGSEDWPGPRVSWCPREELCTPVLSALKSQSGELES